MQSVSVAGLWAVFVLASIAWVLSIMAIGQSLATRDDRGLSRSICFMLALCAFMVGCAIVHRWIR